jgi:hypothetical protein
MNDQTGRHVVVACDEASVKVLVMIGKSASYSTQTHTGAADHSPRVLKVVCTVHVISVPLRVKENGELKTQGIIDLTQGAITV